MFLFRGVPETLEALFQRDVSLRAEGWFCAVFADQLVCRGERQCQREAAAAEADHDQVGFRADAALGGVVDVQRELDGVADDRAEFVQGHPDADCSVSFRPR